jgi:hypothetical protein
MKWMFGALALTIGASGAQAQGQATPLFASDDPIKLTITGPVRAVARSGEKSNVSQNATMTVGGTAESLSIRLSPRGISRRRKDICQFAPLRVDLLQAPPATSLFAGQRSLKLVTHCRESASFNQHTLLEYSAYRLFNLLTPTSFRARLATIDYVEPDGKATTRYGFFIEDLDDVAKRNGLRRANVGDRVAAAQLENTQAGRVSVFQYMIGNLDWSMRAGPPGQGCCHNSRLLQGSGPGMISVPYDFDHSGLVDAPYATPPEIFKISSVRNRVYQGYCRHIPAALATIATMRTRRAEIEGTVAATPFMDERTRRKAAAYIARFFEDIATNQTADEKVFKRCSAG